MSTFFRSNKGSSSIDLAGDPRIDLAVVDPDQPVAARNLRSSYDPDVEGKANTVVGLDEEVL